MTSANEQELSVFYVRLIDNEHHAVNAQQRVHRWDSNKTLFVFFHKRKVHDNQSRPIVDLYHSYKCNLKEYYSVVLRALTGDRLNKLMQQRLLVPTIGQTPRTLDPTFPITQVSSIFHLTPCFLDVRFFQTAQLQSCSWHHRLQRHRGHHTTIFTGWDTLVTMSKLSFMCKICGTPTIRHTIQSTLQHFAGIFRTHRHPVWLLKPMGTARVQGSVCISSYTE